MYFVSWPLLFESTLFKTITCIIFICLHTTCPASPNFASHIHTWIGRVWYSNLCYNKNSFVRAWPLGVVHDTKQVKQTISWPTNFGHWEKNESVEKCVYRNHVGKWDGMWTGFLCFIKNIFQETCTNNMVWLEVITCRIVKKNNILPHEVITMRTKYTRSIIFM